MITRERIPSHEAPDNTPGKSFDYEKYGISPTVESNSLDGDNFSTPHEWTPAGRAEKVNDARDAVAIAFGDKPPAMARQESNTGRQLLVGEAYKAATDGGKAPTNERASIRRVFMTGEKITGKLPPHVEIPKAETVVAKPSSEPEPKASKENTPPKTARNESPKVEATETKPATSNRTAEKNPAEQVAQPAEDKTSPLEQSDSNQENTLESEADVSKTGEKQAAGEQNTTKPGERQQRANKWAGDFLRAYGGFLDQNVRVELAGRLEAKGGLNVSAETLQAMSRLAREANPRSPVWQTKLGSGSALQEFAGRARRDLQSIIESL